MDAQPVAHASEGMKPTPFQIYTLNVGMMTMKVVDPWNHDYFMLLGKTISQHADFYKHAPVVLDLEPLASVEPFNLAEFVRRVRQHQLVPVGVINASPAWERVATNAGLSLFGKQPDTVKGKTAGASAPSSAELPSPLSPKGLHPPKVVAEPVRSGQQIYAPDSDLVILAPVSHGAELLAGGSIHVYGTLRGRALAGVGGMPGARIFCRGLEAELISIDGTYMVADQIPKEYFGKSIQLRLDGETLIIESLS